MIAAEQVVGSLLDLRVAMKEAAVSPSSCQRRWLNQDLLNIVSQSDPQTYSSLHHRFVAIQQTYDDLRILTTRSPIEYSPGSYQTCFYIRTPAENA